MQTDASAQDASHSAHREVANSPSFADIAPMNGAASPRKRKMRAGVVKEDDEFLEDIERSDEERITKKGRRKIGGGSTPEQPSTPGRKARKVAEQLIREGYTEEVGETEEMAGDEAGNGDGVDAVKEEQQHDEDVDSGAVKIQENGSLASSPPATPQPADIGTPTPKRPRGRPRKKPPVTEPPPEEVPPATGDDNADTEEQETEWDERGETKITKDGELLGGRQYKIRNFRLPRHPTRLYMLTVDISKTLGFRDTYIFFLRNPNIKRITGTEEDRQHLREVGILPAQLRQRPVTLATARTIFRQFGHKAVKRGRPVRDDYWVGDKEEPPDVEEYPDVEEDASELADDSAYADQSRRPNQQLNLLNRGSAGAEHDLGPSFAHVAIPALIAGDDWMYRCAQSAAGFNRRLVRSRPRTFLDVHTNVEQVPAATQPTHVVIEMAEDSEGYPLKVEKETVLAEEAPEMDRGWCRLEETENARAYPLAVIPGQYQGALSLYRQRFSENGTPLTAQMVPGTQSDAASRGYVAFNLAASSTENQATPSKGRFIEFTCGERTRSGEPCKRGVTRQGEKCLYHVKSAADAPSTTECVHCHSAIPPTPKPNPHSSTPKPNPNLLLSCAQCQTKHHPSCIDFTSTVLICKVQTYDWLCSNCKTCMICREAGDDDKLLFCDTCDRGYHTYCLDPPLDGAPEGTWLCMQCAVCWSCDKRPPPHATPAQQQQLKWRHAIAPPAESETGTSLGTYICTYCDECNVNFADDRFCPLCMHVYKEDADDLAMVCCDSCDRWIHVGCDPEITEEMYQEMVEDPDLKYTCILCDPVKLPLFVRKVAVANGVRGGGVGVFRTVMYHGKKIVAPPLVKKAGTGRSNR